jgi:ribosomal protein S18 acetylase RimI-like enzyme
MIRAQLLALIYLYQPVSIDAAFCWTGVAVHKQSAVRAENEVVVRPVASASDVLDLADLRYNEWIGTPDKDIATSSSLRVVSRQAFRRATSEIHDERFSQGAVAFLARRESDNVVVGAAELSPIELQGAVRFTNKEANTSCINVLYITDVVTVRAYRRRGVAMALMQAVERHALASSSASEVGTTSVLLLLHVEPSNHAALKFYRRIQYHEKYQQCTITGEVFVNAKLLAENAGTTGQVLLGKLVSAQNLVDYRGADAS